MTLSQYEMLRADLCEKVDAGQWHQALRLAQEGYECARLEREDSLEQRAFCNLAIVEIELGQGAPWVPRLRELILAARDPRVRFLAAYNLSRALQLARDFPKATFYARIARHTAPDLQDASWSASAHNLLGTLLLELGRTSEAKHEYERGCVLLKDLGHHPWLAVLLQNLGHCKVLTGEIADGARCLEQCRNLLTGRPAPSHSHLHLHLSISFLHLVEARFWEARDHALKALDCGHQLRCREGLKSALFLLGESSKRVCDLTLASWCFDELQTFYPEMPDVTELLMTVDLSEWVRI